MPREIFGIPPRETPAGIWPSPTLPTPPALAPRVEAQPRRAPVPQGAIASSTTVIRPVRFEDDKNA